MEWRLLLCYFLFLLFRVDAASQIIDRSWLMTFGEPYAEDFLQFSPDTSEAYSWKVVRPEHEFIGKAIATGGNAPYPVNDTVRFTIVTPAGPNLTYGAKYAHFKGEYRVDCDSLNDYGMIELSLDKGNTWLDLVNDTSLQEVIPGLEVTLTGKSDGWQTFFYILTDVSHYYDVPDTVHFRFSFISDSIPENRTGLMFDNIYMNDVLVSIGQRDGPHAFHSQITPNPVTNEAWLDIFRQQPGICSLTIYNLMGAPVMQIPRISKNRIHLNTATMKTGIYYYVVKDQNTKQTSMGKILKQ